MAVAMATASSVSAIGPASFQGLRALENSGVTDGSQLFGLLSCKVSTSTNTSRSKGRLHRRESRGNSYQRAAVSVRSAAAASAPKKEKDPKKRVVITGMGVVSVYGNEVDVFYDKLLEGVSGISVIDRFDPSEFPTTIAGQIRGFDTEGYITDKQEKQFEACLQYGIVSGKKAMENAGLGKVELEKMDKMRVGALVGSGIGAQDTFANGVVSLLNHEKMSPYFIPHTNVSAASALLGIELGLMGPNYSISTACATSNYCIYAAANHIREGDADVMIAGGTEAPITPTSLGGFTACRALSQSNADPPAASRPWDKSRNGFVMGEGAGVLIMESLEHALKRGATILAEYLGGGVSCDAYNMTDPHADGRGVAFCIERSLEDAGVSREEVNYVNCHATSTLLGDVAEINALKKVWTTDAMRSEMKINGTKSMIGHSLGGAGGLEAIVTVKAITTGWLHPTLNQHDLDPAVVFDTVPNVKKQHAVNIAISNSFGFGGHNSSIVFGPYLP
ncbi:unnamed protein product [Calypogeia fissa]